MLHQVIQDTHMFLTDIESIDVTKCQEVYLEVKLPTVIDVYYIVGMLQLWKDVQKKLGRPLRLYGYCQDILIEKYLQHLLFTEDNISLVVLHEGESLCLPI